MSLIGKLMALACVAILVESAGFAPAVFAQTEEAEAIEAAPPQWSSLIQFSAGLGYGFGQKSSAMEGFPDTKTNVNPFTLHAHLRLGYVRDQVGSFWKFIFWKSDHLRVGPSLDLSYYRTSLELEEMGSSFGDYLSNWVILTPGIAFSIPSKDGAAFSGGNGFWGLVGFGFVSTTFRDGSVIELLEEIYNVSYTVDVENSTALAILPIEYQAVLYKKLTIGFLWSGILMSKAGTEWAVDGLVSDELSKDVDLYNSQFVITLGLAIN